METIYLAAPLFTEAEKRFNSYLAEKLREKGHTVFVPQEIEYDYRVKPLSPELKQEIYHNDIQGLTSATLVVAVIDGSDADSGTSFEIGYAVARGTPVYCLRTDVRKVDDFEFVNLMLESETTVFTSVEKLLKAL